MAAGGAAFLTGAAAAFDSGVRPETTVAAAGTGLPIIVESAEDISVGTF